jgi:hypothetical protein
MAPQHMRRPAALARGEPCENDHVGNPEDSASKAPEQWLRTYADLRRLTRDLEAIADWKADLASRLCRAELRFEYVGLGAEEQEALVAEVHAFNQVCRGLAGGRSAMLPERKAA